MNPSLSSPPWRISGSIAVHGRSRSRIALPPTFFVLLLVVLGGLDWKHRPAVVAAEEIRTLRQGAAALKADIPLNLDTADVVVFGPALMKTSASHLYPTLTKDNRTLAWHWSDTAQQRSYLQAHPDCQVSSSSSTTDPSFLLDRFDALPDVYATELWKYCVLYSQLPRPTSKPHVWIYLDPNNAISLVNLEDTIDALLWQLQDASHRVLALRIAAHSLSPTESPQVSSSLLVVQQSSNQGSSSPMIRVSEELLQYYLTQLPDGTRVAVKLGRSLMSHAAEHLIFWKAQCAFAKQLEEDSHDARSAPQRALTLASTSPVMSCPTGGLSYCCQVVSSSATMSDRDPQHAVPLLALRQTYLTVGDAQPKSGSAKDTDSPMIYIESIPTHVGPVSNFESPNFYDILLENDCLPDYACLQCLQQEPMHRSSDHSPATTCQDCQEACPCYCQALCRIRPPPKPVSAEWRLTSTSSNRRTDPTRLIPRKVHQAWPMSNLTAYPNTGRLIESFRQSGWEHHLYALDDGSDARHRGFLEQHFPEEVLEAYNALTNPALQSQLLLYCKLLIHGGVMADARLLLESHLDVAIPSHVDLVVVSDLDASARCNSWNGFVAAAPGHPVIAQLVEHMINHIRNRFAPVDWDEAMCPETNFAVTHDTVQDHFFGGSCLLAWSLRQVYNRPMSAAWNVNSHAADENGRLDRVLFYETATDDMGARRFTWKEENLIVAATDMEEQADNTAELDTTWGQFSVKPSLEYVGSRSEYYVDTKRANSWIRILPSH